MARKLTTDERRALQMKAATAVGLSQTLAGEVKGDTWEAALADAQRRHDERRDERRSAEP